MEIGIILGSDPAFRFSKSHLWCSAVVAGVCPYAWDNAATGSLYNAAGLPVGTFTSEPVPEV